MPKYTCVSSGESGEIFGSPSTINAESPKEAAEAFFSNKRENGFAVFKVTVKEGPLEYSFSFDDAQETTPQSVQSTPHDQTLIAIEKMAKTQTDILETLKGIKLVITLFALWIILQAWIIKFQF